VVNGRSTVFLIRANTHPHAFDAQLHKHADRLRSWLASSGACRMPSQPSPHVAQALEAWRYDRDLTVRLLGDEAAAKLDGRPLLV
jgi:hypothetical protein